MKRENSFVKAGAVLVLSGFAVKLLSALYRIPLTRMLGAAQMGRYSAVFSLFMPFLSFATAGIVPCVAHFTAKIKENGSVSEMDTLRRKAMILYIFQALVMAVCFVAFGQMYSQRQGDSIFFAGSVILAPTILFAAAENICKGLTQGRMDMLPTAAANVLESVLKTALGLAGVYFAGRYFWAEDGDAAVKAGLFAVTVSGLVCCLYLIYAVSRRRKHLSGNAGKAAAGVFKSGKQVKNSISQTNLLKMSFPIAISALTMSLSGFFDTAVCLPRIADIPYSDIVQSFDGASFKNAGDMPMYLLGIYQGMVLTVFNLLPAVLSYIGTASLPLVSRGVTLKNKGYIKRQTDRLFTITAGVSVPVTVYIFIFRTEILQFLFGTNTAQTVVSSQLLGILLLGSVFCCFTSVFNSVMYAFGKSGAVFRILIAASLVKCTLNYILCGIGQINIKAFAVSACVFYTIIFMLSVVNIKRLGTEFRFFRIFFMPCVASAVAVSAVLLLDSVALCWLPLFLKLCFSAVMYTLIYLLIAIITGFLLISPSENSNI